MKIAVLAHVRHPIRPPFKGGMEAHAWHLTRALMRRGHDVTLFASGDSDPALPVCPVLCEHYDRTYPWHAYRGTDALNRHLDAAHGALVAGLAAADFDVVHNNSLHRYPPRAARALGLPMVTSLHIPPFDTLHRAVRSSTAPWHRFTVTSELQRRTWWPEGAPPTASVVHNGIDLGAWRPGPGGGPAIWAGRITPNKGTHLAAAAARRAGVAMDIYGVIEDRDYFADRVAPHLGNGVVYRGHACTGELARAFRRASVLVFTPLWNEPFGLAAIEAMACGVPVAAVEMGAVREVVGDCGAYAAPDDVTGLALAIRRAREIPRARPRARAEALFGIDAMVSAHERLYRAAVAGLRTDLPPPRYTRRELDLPQAAH